MVIRAGEALRAGAVMLGGPTALAGAALASGLGSLRAIREGRRPSPIALGGLAGLAVYLGAVRSWMRNWGATEDEANGSLPGDEDVSDSAGQTTRAVTIGAPAADVWPWIAQMGQDRGGFYSYEWLENLAGCRMRNADRIHPEWQHREVGELVMLHPANAPPRPRSAPPRPCAHSLLQPLPRVAAFPDGTAHAPGHQGAGTSCVRRPAASV